jgi:hypothetical protein
MTNTFLILLDAHNDQVRVRADAISSYIGNGLFTTVHIDGVNIDVQHTVEQIDQALTETYFMLKPVETS